MNSTISLPPCEGKQGWPWTTEINQILPCSIPDGLPWPKISIITPSFNQAQYLEETIRSVLLQGYPNLEYIIMDGGSTDGSVEIIKKYEHWLTYWISEKDKGQAQAINKGFAKSSGEILAWINSDDYYLENVISKIAIAFQKAPDVEWIIGNLIVFEQENIIRTLTCSAPQKLNFMNCLKDNYSMDFRCNQPASFWKRIFLDKNGPLHENYHYAFDSEWFSRAILRNERPLLLDESLAAFRVHENSKTISATREFSGEIFRLLLKKSLHREIKPLQGIKLSLDFLRQYYKLSWSHCNSRKMLGNLYMNWIKKQS